MNENWLFWWNRVREKLWVKPMAICLLSIAAAFIATLADGSGMERWIPDISTASIEKLLDIVSSTNLVIAMFSVGSMVSAYASAAGSATPRSFPLVVADDSSQYALSTFIGTFIFSVVALIALKNGYYEKAGLFTLFVLTIVVFALVILAFLRWVDSIARLGRIGNTIDKVELAASNSFAQRLAMPHLGGKPLHGEALDGQPVFLPTIGYLQKVDMLALQNACAKAGLTMSVLSLPGAFCTPNRPVARIHSVKLLEAEQMKTFVQAFTVADQRTFDQDPRFGVVVLCEIASRALSPAVNDPGTAIDVIGTLVRLFHLWANYEIDPDFQPPYPLINVPDIHEEDLFDDAFTGIARDGAGAVEVGIRLQKAFEAMAEFEDEPIRKASIRQSRLALARSEKVLSLPQDLDAVRAAAAFAS